MAIVNKENDKLKSNYMRKECDNTENTVIRSQILAIRNQSIGNRNQYWSDEDRIHLRDDYLAGIGISEMAVIYGRSECAIFMQLHEMGLIQTEPGSKRMRKIKCKCPKCGFYEKCKGESVCSFRK